jgi:predicted phage terminase large subunit-like protein
VTPEINLQEEAERFEAEECRRSFARYVRKTWNMVDPDPLIWGWHMQAMCDHLQAVTEGRIQRLLINIPPGHAKSMVVSVLWPTWVWTRNPKWRVLTGSYVDSLTLRDSVRARDFIRDPWYERNFMDTWSLAGDQNAKGFYSNTAKGSRFCLSVGSTGTGWRGDALVIDDPINVADASSKLKRQEVIDWKTATMSSRFNDPAKAQEVVIMQRVHDEDLSGWLLKRGGWQHLCLPSRFEPERRSKTFAVPAGMPLDSDKLPFWEDPRQTKGQVLFPQRYPEKVLQHFEGWTGMGPIAFAGQHQQRPMPAGGGVIKESFFGRRWHTTGLAPPPNADQIPGYTRREYNPAELNPKRSRIIVSDLSFKKTEDSDRVAILVCDILFPDLYVIDWAWDRMGFIKSVEEIKRLRAKWSGYERGHISKVCIEDRANGSAVIEVLKKSVPGVFPIQPLGSKEARIEAASPYLQSGNVWMPDQHPQLDDFVLESITFPKGSHDDSIDALAYAILIGLSGNNLGFLQKIVKW